MLFEVTLYLQMCVNHTEFRFKVVDTLQMYLQIERSQIEHL